MEGWEERGDFKREEYMGDMDVRMTGPTCEVWR